MKKNIKSAGAIGFLRENWLYWLVPLVLVIIIIIFFWILGMSKGDAVFLYAASR